MQIMNNTSPSFGSIQVNAAKMTRSQRNISERIFDTLKYSDKYAKYTENNLDIYILPTKSTGTVEVRIMDPFSGSFIRDEKGSMVRENIRNTVSEKFEGAIDSILEIYDKVMQGIMPRPKEDLAKIMMGKTEMAKINPVKQENLENLVFEHMEEGYSQEGAYNQYKSLYPIGNYDADFESM